MREQLEQYQSETYEDDLYVLYLNFMAQTRAEVAARTPPGTFRERLLRTYSSLPREHFEARLESMCAGAGDYEAAVASLRRGFVPRCGQFQGE
jgi:hypothetical protein